MLNVVDNFGACCVMCIKVLDGSYCRYAGAGDIIKTTIKEAISRGKVKRGDAPKAIVVHTKKGARCPDGFVVCFDGDACILLNNNSRQSISTRTFGPAIRELRSEKFMKIISLVSEVL